MESKKNTFQIVLIGILTVLVLILAAALYRSWRVEGELRAQLAEAQNNAMTVENEQGTQLAAAADNALTVRVMNGILQQQDASGQWLDVAPVEELRQADPVLAGRTKMENLIAQNKEAVQNGLIDEEKISPILSKQSVFMGASLARASQVQSTADETNKCYNYGYCTDSNSGTYSTAGYRRQFGQRQLRRKQFRQRQFQRRRRRYWLDG